MNLAIPLIAIAGIALALSGKKTKKTTRGATPLLDEPVVINPNTGANFLVFEAEWCQACKKAKPLLVEIRDRHPAIVFTFIDIDNNPDLSNKYNINAVPTIVVLVNGKEIDRIEGAKTADRYESAAVKAEGAKALPAG